MKGFLQYSLACALAAIVAMGSLVSGCLDRGTPLPDLKGEILAMEVKGGINPAAIDPARRTIALELSEEVDPRSVEISLLTLTKGGSCDIAVGDKIDLTSPRRVTVRTVAGYEWTISATQNIDYIFEVEGFAGNKPVKQLGAPYLEVHASSRSIFAYVPEETDLERITITGLKLWPAGVEADVSPEWVRVGEKVSFTPSSKSPKPVRQVTVKYRDVVETWFLYVAPSTTMIEGIDPFAYKVNLVGVGASSEGCGFEYRPAAGYDPVGAPDDGWIRVPSTGSDGDYFRATVTALTPTTHYLVRAFADSSVSSVEEFSTTGTRELPGGSLDEWHRGKRSGMVNIAWNPWPEGGEWEDKRWWDSGNKGVVLIDSKTGGNSVPCEGSPLSANPQGQGAKLETKMIASVKIAGGNLYFGRFGKLEGLDATCHIGHNWRGNKPTKLRGWFKYSPKQIDNVSAPHAAIHPWKLTEAQWKASTDSLNICVALWASPDGREIPFTVDSNPGRFVDFSRDKAGVIAFGALVSCKPQSEWASFEIPIDYLKAGALPDNVQLYVLATASKNCNYFIAGTGSTLWVDDFTLEYE